MEPAGLPPGQTRGTEAKGLWRSQSKRPKEGSMLIKLRNRMAREESGFTLVELLVVMLILGILAAIAIPTFFNQRDKARDADAKTGARTAETAMETYATENGGSYGTVPATVEARLVAIEPTLQASRLEVTYPAGAAYAVTYDSTNT